MERTEIGRPWTLDVTWRDQDDDSTASDGDTTIGIVDAEGTVVVAPTTISSQGTDGAYRYQLEPQTAPAHLTASWSATVDGLARTLTQTVEVAGARYTTPAALRARHDQLENRGRWPTASLWASILEFEQRAEAWTHLALCPRYAWERKVGFGTRRIALGHQAVREIAYCTVDGTAETIADLTVDWDLGLVERNQAWPVGADILFGYRHGLDHPPAPVVDACEAWVGDDLFADTNLISPRAASYATPDGSFIRITPSGKYGPFGMDAVDAALRDVRRERPAAV